MGVGGKCLESVREVLGECVGSAREVFGKAFLKAVGSAELSANTCGTAR